jgi:hypothetical protein
LFSVQVRDFGYAEGVPALNAAKMAGFQGFWLVIG